MRARQRELCKFLGIVVLSWSFSFHLRLSFPYPDSSPRGLRNLSNRWWGQRERLTGACSGSGGAVIRQCTYIAPSFSTLPNWIKKRSSTVISFSNSTQLQGNVLRPPHNPPLGCHFENSTPHFFFSRLGQLTRAIRLSYTLKRCHCRK